MNINSLINYSEGDVIRNVFEKHLVTIDDFHYGSYHMLPPNRSFGFQQR